MIFRIVILILEWQQWKCRWSLSRISQYRYCIVWISKISNLFPCFIYCSLLFNKWSDDGKIIVLYIFNKIRYIVLGILSPIFKLGISNSSQLIAAKKCHTDSMHENSCWLHAGRTCQCHLANITVYFVDKRRLNKFFRTLDIFTQDLVGVSVEDVWYPFGNLCGFPYCPNDPRCLTTFSTSDKYIIIFKS